MDSECPSIPELLFGVQLLLIFILLSLELVFSLSLVGCYIIGLCFLILVFQLLHVFFAFIDLAIDRRIAYNDLEVALTCILM